MTLFRPYQAVIFLAVSLVMIYFTVPSNKDLGMYYFNSFEYDKAVTYLIEGDSFDSDDIFVLKKLKDYSLIQGDVDKAYQTQLKLVSLKPKNREYLLEAEKLADWAEKGSEKLRLKEKRAELELKYSEENAHQIFLEVGQGYRYLKDFENADRLFNRIATFPKKEFKEQTIRYFLARKNVSRSEELLKVFAEEYPDDDELSYFYYQTLVFQDKHEEAVLTLLQVLFPDENFSELEGTQVSSVLKKQRTSFYIKERNRLEKLAEGFFTIINSKKSNMFKEDDFFTVIGIYEGKFPRYSQLLLNLFRRVHKAYPNYIDRLINKLRESAVGQPQEIYREVHLELAEVFIDKKIYPQAVVDLERLTTRFPLNRRYWQMLAEVYELSGLKQKSIKAFFKLYQLQKRKVDQTYLKSIPPSHLYVEVSNTVDVPKFSPSAKEIEKEKLRGVEGRLIGTIYSLDDPSEKLDAFQKLLEENPESINALKGKAYTLYELDRNEEAKELFKYIYTMNPKDPDANRSQVDRWINEKEWTKLKESQGILLEKYSQTEVDSILRDYYYQKDSKKYKRFCHNTKDSNALIDCLYRNESSYKALELAQDLSDKNPQNCDYFVKRLYLEAEVGQLEWIEKQRKEEGLYQKCISTKTQKELESFVYSQNQFRRSGQFWRYEHSFGLLDTDRFQLGDMQIGLMRKLKTWAIGLEGRHDRILRGGEAKFNFVSLGVTKFFKNGSALTLGPTQTFGDKKAWTGLFARYTFNLQSIFFSAEVFTHNPLRFTRDLASESSAYSSGGEFYSNYRTVDREYNLIGSAILQNVHYRDKSSFFSQFTVEGLKRFYTDKRKKPTELLAGLQVSNSNLSSPQPVLRDNFLNKSLAIHGVLKLDYNYPENFFPRKWSGFLRLGFGGDLIREVDFFKSLQVIGQINKAIGKRAKVFFSGEYYSEFLGVNRGDTRVFRLGFLQDF